MSEFDDPQLTELLDSATSDELAVESALRSVRAGSRRRHRRNASMMSAAVAILFVGGAVVALGVGDQTDVVPADPDGTILPRVTSEVDDQEASSTTVLERDDADAAPTSEPKTSTPATLPTTPVDAPGGTTTTTPPPEATDDSTGDAPASNVDASVTEVTPAADTATPDSTPVTQAPSPETAPTTSPVDDAPPADSDGSPGGFPDLPDGFPDLPDGFPDSPDDGESFDGRTRSTVTGSSASASDGPDGSTTNVESNNGGTASASAGGTDD